MSVVIEANNLQKYYNNFQAVAGVDFQVKRSMCFGILGPNGAGKTTTVGMIYCFTPISGGELNVLEMDVTRHPRKIKSRLGVVPQENNLDQELTVWENLLVYANYYGIKRSSAKEKAKELLNFFGLSEKAHHQVEQISGGMKRRLTIARGLIHTPEILILDEPTTGLDPQSRRLIWEHLRQLKNRGLTLILTTHYLEEASHLCDDLIIMDDGIILEEGKPYNLIQKHVGEKIVEIDAEEAKINTVLEEIAPLSSGYQLAGQTIFLYIRKDENPAVNKLNSFDYVNEYRVRPSNLEDVFLKLTGKGLSYGEFD